MRWRPAIAALALGSCNKVPIYSVGAGFTLADAAWFSEEETLFVFYEVRAEQGLGDPSVIEVRYATDDERVPWTALSELTTVHPHVAVDCGVDALCGSASLHVPQEPREVAVRLRYHRDGALALSADTVFNVVGPGDPHSHRSLVIYGVFDETNQRVQWRARHQLPTLRNQEVEALGLRRDFLIEDQRYGTAEVATARNPYGYGVDCPGDFIETDLDRVGSNQRAIFDDDALPLDASAASTVCAESTVTDATGYFTTPAIARKNPEVRPAFPVLRSPIHETATLPFFLGYCERAISDAHEEMQRQRLQIGDLPTYCIDDWAAAGFVDELVIALREAVEAARPAGDDMMLLIGLQHDESGVSEAVEQALARVVPQERHRSSPRLAGAFVFDSDARAIEMPSLGPVTLWCPATIPTDDEVVVGIASLACAILPDNPEIDLGPFSFSSLPILPSLEQYLDFIDTYSEDQAGEVESLRFLAPEFTTTSDHIDLGDFGVVTFLNGELISAEADDAFSYCSGDDPPIYVFRSEFIQSELFGEIVADDCESLGFSEDVCAAAQVGVLPLAWLPRWHDLFGESTYELGIFWDFPYLLRMEYELFTAGSVTAFGFSVPFGLSDSTEAEYGTQIWTTDAFSLEELLTQCSRFCDHPTFDSAGVYNVTTPFRTTYASRCYQPAYPAPGDSGFPLDP